MIIAKNKYEYINILIEKIEHNLLHNINVATLQKLGWLFISAGALPFHIFAVYNVKESFSNPAVKMYCPVKLVQNDNTNFKEDDR